MGLILMFSSKFIFNKSLRTHFPSQSDMFLAILEDCSNPLTPHLPLQENFQVSLLFIAYWRYNRRANSWWYFCSFSINLSYQTKILKYQLKKRITVQRSIMPQNFKSKLNIVKLVVSKNQLIINYQKSIYQSLFK